MTTKEVEPKHGTIQEIEFLDNLGFHSDNGFDRAMLLKNYIDAARTRTDWDKIDRAAVLTHADRLLQQEVAANV